MSDLWRCFVAWSPVEPARAALLDLIATLARQRPDRGYRWTRDAQLHLTLRFLGDSDPAQRDAIAARLAEVAQAQSAIAAWTAGWQFWPSRATPRVLVLRVESGGALESLGARLEGEAREVGFAPERRAFRAHLTLARIDRLREPAAAFDAPPPRIELAVDHLALVRSESSAQGSRYTELAGFRLS